MPSPPETPSEPKPTDSAAKLPLTDEQIRAALLQDDLVAPRRSKFAWAMGTVFGIGMIGKGGGSVAAGVTAAIWWILAAYIVPSPWIWPLTLLLSIIITLQGIRWSDIVAKELGKEDPSEVVIDEVAGQLIALLWAPIKGPYVLAAFILFRIFDIFKPPPIRQLERLRGGLGIMMDDVGAGIMALAVLRIALHYNRL